MISTRIGFMLEDLFHEGILKLAIAREFAARLRCKRFYCNALNGTSDYNISINCDMTVSCSCQDFDCSGNIGDLDSQSFVEIFKGAKAREFCNKCLLLDKGSQLAFGPTEEVLDIYIKRS